MERILVALALGLCVLAVGCPKRLVETELDGDPARGAQAGTTQHQPEAGGRTDAADGETAALAGSAAEGQAGEAPAGADDFIGPLAQDGTAAEGQTQDGGAGGDGPQAGGAKAGETDPAPGAGGAPAAPNLLDPGTGGDDVVNGPPGYGAQQQAAGSASLAGTWQVVSATAEGASLTFTPGDWELKLDDDGTATITRTDGGTQRQQSGTWQAIKGAVSFNLGPGGQPSYTVSGNDPDMQVFADEAGQTALFAVRLAPGATVPQLFQRYDTDFGALKFAQAGQGVWEGSYGNSGGRLTVRLTGPFCTGTWEQGASRGGVILRLTGGGFTGWWWYDGSLTIDGSWNGTTGQ